MKKLLIGLLVLGSFSVLAQESNVELKKFGTGLRKMTITGNAAKLLYDDMTEVTTFGEFGSEGTLTRHGQDYSCSYINETIYSCDMELSSSIGKANWRND